MGWIVLGELVVVLGGLGAGWYFLGRRDRAARGAQKARKDGTDGPGGG